MNKLMPSRVRAPCRFTSTSQARWAGGLLFSALCAVGASAQQLEPECGNPLVNGYGPYDYRFDRGPTLKIVEDYHFTPRVESLISGVSGTLGGELDYTLRAYPNHHRALVAMMNLGTRLKQAIPPGAQFSVECYFKRALAFKSDDGIVRMLYAKFLAGIGRKMDALRQLDSAVQAAGDNAFTHYNAGLVYFEIGEMDKALAQAHRTIALGGMRPELQQRLQAANKWANPPEEATAPASAASAPRPPELPASR